MKQKAFFIIFKGFSLKQIKTIFLEGESPTLTYVDTLIKGHQRNQKINQFLKTLLRNCTD